MNQFDHLPANGIGDLARISPEELSPDEIAEANQWFDFVLGQLFRDEEKNS